MRYGLVECKSPLWNVIRQSDQAMVISEVAKANQKLAKIYRRYAQRSRNSHNVSQKMFRQQNRDDKEDGATKTGW